MASGGTHYSTAQSGPLGASEQFHSAAGSGGGGGVGGAGIGPARSSGGGGSSEQSVSLAPPAWAARARAFVHPTAAAAGAPLPGPLAMGPNSLEEDDDLPQQGSTADLEGVESLRESSVVVRPVLPPEELPADGTDGTPLAQAWPRVEVAVRQSGSMTPSPPRQPGGRRGVAPAAAAAEAAPAWDFPRRGSGSGQLAQGAAVYQQPPPPPVVPLQQPAPKPLAAQQQQQQAAWQGPAAQRYAPPPLPHDPLPPLAAQQPLPPGRYGWQRNPHLPSKEDTLLQASSVLTQETGRDAAPSAPSLDASRDSWLSSVAGGPGAAGAAGAALPTRQPAQQGPPPLPHPTPFRPPSASSAVMHRGPSSQQQLLPAEAAIYSEAGVEAGAGGGRSGTGDLFPSAKSSPAKSGSLDVSAFHVEAFAGAAAAAGGCASGEGTQQGLRPSRTAALRKRHQAQLRRVDRDQYGVPVTSSARPFSLWASPQTIGEACAGLGAYFASVKQFIIAALLLSLVAIYPLTSNMTSQRWAASYTLVADQEPLLQCSKGWDTSSWVTGTTAGSRCGSSRYSSSFDCPSLCTWSSARLRQGQCAGLPPPALPAGGSAASSRSGNATCLLHPPCSAASSTDPSAPGGPCYCCELELDPLAAAAATPGAGPVPVAQLWVLLVGQLAFLIWVLFLTRSQLHAVHSADARVITASDYTVRLQGVPQGLSSSELQQWCSHYGSVVAAYHIPDVGEAIRVAQRLHSLQIRCAEADAWLASSSCSTAACWFNLWALGATSRQRLRRAAEDAALELSCYQRQELQPTGAALAMFEYAEHAANCIEDHHRPAMRRTVDALLCGATASAPRLASSRIRIDRAPEPSDILWENTSCTGSAALWRRLWSGLLTLLIVAVGAGVQYGLAVAGEEERKKRLSQLYRYNHTIDYTFDFSTWASFTASALEVTKLNAISILSGLAVVVVNWLVTVAVRQLAVLERWHTRTAGERWALMKLSVAYLVNSFVVPLLAAYFAGSSNSWYSRGGLMESAFYMQMANALLPPLAVLCDLQEFFLYHLLSRSAKTQAMMDHLLQPLPFLLAEQYASALTTLGVAICWMPVLPISPLIAVLGLFFAYWADKIVALRRTAHPGNMRGKLVSSADMITRLLPLVQLLLMRFVYFVGEGAMAAVFWTGLAVWLLFAVAPLRSFLGLVPRRRSTVTGGLSFQETLGRGQRKGLDDQYEAEVPPCCSPAYRTLVGAVFTPLLVPLSACEAPLPGQKASTGGAATRPPFRPDRSADRAVARAAASLRARQQAVLSASMAASISLSEAGRGGSGGGDDSGSSWAAKLAGQQQQQGGGLPQAAAALPPRACPPRHQRQPSASRLAHTLSAVRDGLASGASWLLNTPNPDDLFSYDWRRAQDEGDTCTSASAPPLPGQAFVPARPGGTSADSSRGGGPGWGGSSGTGPSMA